jgi:YtkA-like
MSKNSLRKFPFATLIACTALLIQTGLSFASLPSADPDLNRSSPQEVHLVTQHGFQLAFMLQPPEQTAAAKGDMSELMLFLADRNGKPVSHAKVAFTVVSPGGATMESAARHEAGRYASGVYSPSAGTYVVKAEVQVGKQLLSDWFTFQVD